MRLHPDIERVALLGWHLYPTSMRTKAACLRGATDAATCDLDQIERWSREFPGCNWRVVFGPSGLWGLDCDVPPGHAHDGIANLNALVKLHGPLPARPQARSGGGGLALFFRNDGEPIIGEAGHPALGIDPRRGRQSQTIPPLAIIAPVSRIGGSSLHGKSMLRRRLHGCCGWWRSQRLLRYPTSRDAANMRQRAAGTMRWPRCGTQCSGSPARPTARATTR